MGRFLKKTLKYAAYSIFSLALFVVGYLYADQGSGSLVSGSALVPATPIAHADAPMLPGDGYGKSGNPYYDNGDYNTGDAGEGGDGEGGDCGGGEGGGDCGM